MVAIISTINLKGGVGKTTTAVALAEAFASEERRRVLVIDLDPQTNATVMLIGEDRWKEVNDEDQTLARLFKDGLEPDSKRFDVHKALQKDVGGTRRARSTGRNERGRVDLLPSSIDLIDVQDRLASIPPGRFYANQPIDLLRRAVESILSDYDNVLIDCPPNLGIITLNGLRISTGYIIPTIPDVLSTYGIPQIVSRVSAFSEEVGEEITPLGTVKTPSSSRSLSSPPSWTTAIGSMGALALLALRGTALSLRALVPSSPSASRKLASNFGFDSASSAMARHSA